MKKLIISENKLLGMLSEELSKKDILSLMKTDKDIERRVKELAGEVVVSLFKVLWQQRNFYDKTITK